VSCGQFSLLLTIQVMSEQDDWLFLWPLNNIWGLMQICGGIDSSNSKWVQWRISKSHASEGISPFLFTVQIFEVNLHSSIFNVGHFRSTRWTLNSFFKGKCTIIAWQYGLNYVQVLSGLPKFRQD
jgi:hypothetical protein